MQPRLMCALRSPPCKHYTDRIYVSRRRCIVASIQGIEFHFCAHVANVLYDIRNNNIAWHVYMQRALSQMHWKVAVMYSMWWLCWKMIKGKMVRKDDNVTVVKMLTGTLYLFRGDRPRAEFVRFK